MASDATAEGFSPKLLARILGFLGLAGIVTGAFDLGYVHTHLIVAGNPALTLQNIAAHESLFRAGFSAHLIELVLNIPGELIAFILLRRVNPIVAALAFCAGMVGIAVEAAALIPAYIPLELAINHPAGPALGAFTTDQIHNLANLATDLQVRGLLLSWVFYGVEELSTGFLFFRSGFIPRILGAMLALSGLCYFTHGLLSFLAPALDMRIYPYIIYPCLPGEGLSSLWLAIMGISMAKWEAWPAQR
jgi:Domain of unknown function (DUF4386)